MLEETMSRRRFLVRTSTGLAALGASASVVRRAYGANERLSIGVIGVGDRASAHLASIQSLSKKMNVEITAVCDVWQPNLRRAAATVGKATGKEPRQFTKFSELLALKDVDAVVIATPDFAHGPIMVAALKAGKDVYVEKPMTMELDSANEALNLARKGNRIVQAGTQFRSDGSFIAASKVLASGVIGKINRICAQANFNEGRWNRSFADCKETEVDWKAYLLNLRRRPFDPSLLRRWHFYRECTNGLSGLWMSHYVDAVHLLTGAKYPASAVSNGSIYVWKDGRQHTDTFHAVLDYPEGFLFDWGFGLGNSAGCQFAVYGTDGTLVIGNDHMTPNIMTISADGGRKDSKVQTQKIKPELSQSHMENWLECIRTRKRPNADIQFGHQHAAATIMAADALFKGKRMKYNVERRKIYAG